MNTFDIRDFGAVCDETIVNTASIQAAIDACAEAGGGTVLIREGTYITGTLFMRSNVELRIDASGVLKASADTSDFPDFTCPQWDVRKAPRATGKCMIYFGYIQNAALCGMGRIDCSGSAYCDPVEEDGKVIKYIRNTLLVPARMVFLMGCTNIRIEDITMTEMAGGWGYWINNCQYITVSKAKLYCNPMYPNSDGIHINCSSDVLVEGCVIHSGDDSIIIRANTNTLSQKRPCERIIIKGCILSSICQAVRIAWRNDGTIRNCTLSDLVITHSRYGIKIELPNHSNPTDVGTDDTVVENIRIHNVVMDSVEQAPVCIIVHPDNRYGIFKNIRFTGISANAGNFPQVIGRQDALVENISFTDCHFTVKTMKDHPESFIPCFRNVKNLQLSNTTFDVLEQPVSLEKFI